ncbi:MAG: acylphosphatase [Betaproteobacteria bacterium]|nr:acylphosphatase [Betaproteobacteria bacterium]
MAAVVTRRLLVAGRVQGVNYRESMRAEAARLGIAGWVRNRRDGRVEAVMRGPADAVDALIAWARSGPPAARVSDVQTDDAQLPREHEGFVRLATE